MDATLWLLWIVPLKLKGHRERSSVDQDPHMKRPCKIINKLTCVKRVFPVCYASALSNADNTDL